MQDSKKVTPEFPDLDSEPIDLNARNDAVEPDGGIETEMTAEEAAEAIMDLAEEEIPSLPEEEDPVIAIQAELAESREKMLRALADAENARRIAKRDVDDARKYGMTKFARDLVEVADNFDRTLETIPEDHADPVVKSIAEGVQMIQRQLSSIFERHGIVQVNPVIGDKFDHKFHQAMFEMPTADMPAGNVAQVMKIGYRIEDRLLRAAMVGVARAPDVAAQPVDED